MTICGVDSSGYYCATTCANSSSVDNWSPSSLNVPILCPNGYYCPIGSTAPLACTQPGTTCLEGSYSNDGFCPAGSYCETTALSETCPQGYYCRQGSTAPRPCPVLGYCAAGAAGPVVVWKGFFAILLTFLVAFVFLRLHRRFFQKQNLGPADKPQQTEKMVSLLRAMTVMLLAAEEESEPEPAPSVDGSAIRPSAITLHNNPPLTYAGALATPVVASTPRTPNTRDRAQARGGSSAILHRFPTNKVADTTQTTQTIEKQPSHDTLAKAVMGASVSNLQANPKLAPAELGELLRVQIPISLDFEHIYFDLQGKKNQRIINDISGSFGHSKMHAVLGPSGAGKTTLMNVLCGKTGSMGQWGGSMRFNGVEASAADLQTEIGFVAQDDILSPDLTVYENLLYNARLRSPRGTTSERIEQIVHATIALLGLETVQHTVCGNVEARGISGGQRKRVNIGIEIVSAPSLLFMDEPTSGLDATASLDILAALHRLTSIGMTIIMVIHQPRYSIVQSFHQVTLLGKGGHTVFSGTVSQAEKYFDKLGFTLPLHENPADFWLDIISGEVQRENDPYFQPSDLKKLWQVEGGWVRDGLETPPDTPSNKSHATETTVTQFSQQHYPSIAVNQTPKRFASHSRNASASKIQVRPLGLSVNTALDESIGSSIPTFDRISSGNPADFPFTRHRRRPSATILSTPERTKTLESSFARMVEGGAAIAAAIESTKPPTTLRAFSSSRREIELLPRERELLQELGEGGVESILKQLPVLAWTAEQKTSSPSHFPTITLSSAQAMNKSAGHAAAVFPATTAIEMATMDTLPVSFPTIIEEKSFTLAADIEESPKTTPSETSEGRKEVAITEIEGEVSKQHAQPQSLGATSITHVVRIHTTVDSASTSAEPSPMGQPRVIASSNEVAKHDGNAQGELHASGGESPRSPSLVISTVASPELQLKHTAKEAFDLNLLPRPRDVAHGPIQLGFLIERQFIKLFRGTFDQSVDMCLCTFVGLALGAIFGGAWNIGAYPTIVTMISLSAGSLACNAALKPFGANRLLFLRETDAGIGVIVRFLAVNAVHLIPLVVSSFLFTSAFFHLLNVDASFGSTFGVVLMIEFATSGFGMLLSVSLPPVPALLIGVVMPLVVGGFLGGVSPRLNTMNGALQFFSWLSYARWSNEALINQHMEASEVIESYRVYFTDTLYSTFGFSRNAVGFNMAMLFVHGMALRLMTLAMLKLRKKF